MRATSRTIMDDEPEEIEALLPWYAAGTLGVRDADRVAEALTRDPALRKQYAAIQEEYAETIHLNENLGAPSIQAMQKLFATIDAEPSRKATVAAWKPTRFGAFLSSLSPRTLSWSASLGALALVLQAGVIGTVLMHGGLENFQSPDYPDYQTHLGARPPAADIGRAAQQPTYVRSTPSSPAAPNVVTDTTGGNSAKSIAAPTRDTAVSAPAPAAAPRMEAAPTNERSGSSSQAARAPAQKFSRSLGGSRDVVAAVTFKSDARMSDISALLGSYHATVIGNSGSTFSLQFEGMTTANDLAVLLSALRNERIVVVAAPTP